MNTKFNSPDNAGFFTGFFAVFGRQSSTTACRYRRHFIVGAILLSLGLSVCFLPSAKLGAGHPASKSSTALDVKPVLPAMPKALPFQESVQNWASIANSRPLFSATRTPFQVVSPAATQALPLPRLAGIIVTSKVKISFFIATDGVPVVAREGTIMGPFTLLSITSNCVRLKSPSGISTLRLSYESNLGTGASITQATEDGGEIFQGTNAWPSSPIN